MDLSLENLKDMTLFRLYGLAQELGVMDRIQNTGNQEDAVNILWDIIKPKDKENIFQVLNNAQKTYIEAKNQMCQLITLLEVTMEKIPKDFATKYQEKNLKECTKIKNELKDNNTEILVFGETGSGKSLFLNTLLGDIILPSTIINSTSAISAIKHSKNKKLRARKTNIRRIEEKEERATKEASEDVDKEKIMNKLFGEKDENKLKVEVNHEWVEKDLSGVLDIEEATREFFKAKKENRGYPLYDYVELHCDSEVLENGITLIDTPGLNENEVLNKMVLKFLPKTTGIICVVNAGQGVTHTLKKFLAEVSKLPSYSANQLFFIVSHWDLVQSESEKIEFMEKMLYEIKNIVPNFEEKNVVKVNLKAASVGSKNKIDNKDYSHLMENLVPFLKRAFKLKLQKQWSILKEVIRYTNNTIKVIFNKTQDIMDDNSLQLLFLLKELENFEKNGESLFREFRDFVKKRTLLLDMKLRELVYSQSFVNDILKELYLKKLPQDDNATLLEAWAERTITEALIHLLSTREDVKFLFKQTQDDIYKGANIVFGKILFDLALFEQQVLNGGDMKPKKEEENKPPPKINFDNINSFSGGDDVNSFNGFTEGEKVGLVVTAPIWIPLGIAVGLLALPVLGISALAKKIKNAQQVSYIRKNEKAWKGEVFKKFFTEENIGIVIDVFVNGSMKHLNSSNEGIISHVQERIDSTRELLKVLLLKRKELSSFAEVFLILRKAIEGISERIYNFYLFNIKHFILHHRLVVYDKNNDGRHIEIGKGAYGTVYKGKLNMQNFPTTPVAIKELSMHDIESSEINNSKLSIQDLISEEDALIDLSCPQIIKYYGCYVKKENNKISTLNLVMRLADGGLDGLINKAEEKPYTNKTVITLATDIALGLKFIHSKNWIHRDLKPANILISDGHALITDLGLCKPVESLTGTIAGTPLYMAPEVYTGSYTNKTDQWSYGLILFELMNRGLKESSFKEPISKEYLRKGVAVVIPKNWDPNYSLIVSKCMSHDPKERPSFSVILELLSKFSSF